MRVLGLIPARGGSKGVPGKNIRNLAGRPLIEYTAIAAAGAKLLSRTILSTDSMEIAKVGRHCGLDVPFLRPPSLAEDTTPMLPVVQDAINALEENGESFDAICLLQPTNPLRSSDDIDRCVERFQRGNFDSVISVLPVPDKYNPHWVYLEDESGTLGLVTRERVPIARRQELPQAFHRDGSVYVTRRDVIMDGNSLYGARIGWCMMDQTRSVNIDSPADWELAEAALAGQTEALASVV